VRILDFQIAITYDHLVDVAKEYDRLTTGDYRINDQADRVRKIVDDLCLETA
jgi:hypothetical protein